MVGCGACGSGGNNSGGVRSVSEESGTRDGDRGAVGE